jgi:hypothetical protein
MGSSNSSMMPMLVLLACCCCSSSASGAGAYFLGYIPGNDKYYIRIFQLEKMFQILEDIKNDMVYEGTAPSKYTGKINGTDFCDEVKDFKENLDEKRKDEIEKVTDDDFKKLVENYMEDNEIKGYTYRQAMNVMDFLYASCGTDDKRVFKKTDAFTTKLTKLFGLKTPPTTNTFTAQKAFCDDVTDGEGAITKQGFKSLHKEITDVTAVSSLDQVWDESTGTLGLSGFSLTDLTSSVDYCATPIAAGCVDNIDSSTCEATTNDPQCVWTDPVMSSTAPETEVTAGFCADIPKCNTFTTNASVPSAATDCPTRCEWTAGTGSAAGSCGDIPAAGGV